jgi:hypothetical protein
MELGAPGSRPVEPLAVDLSINEPICDNQSLVVGDGRRCLWVSTSEDIVDEKLQTFMQQRKRSVTESDPEPFGAEWASATCPAFSRSS